MSYIIYSSDGSLLTTVPTGKINTGSTSISLVGRDVLNYGRHINQDLVYMLSNFAKNTAPKNPIVGQLWFDSHAGKLKVYKSTATTTTFVTIGVAEISGAQPVGQVPGEFWYDTDDSSVNFMDSNGQYVSLTSFPKNNKSGWQYPIDGIHDDTFNSRNVTVLQSNGDVIGAISTSSFTVSGADSTGTFVRAGHPTVRSVDGLTIFGGIKATGALTVGATTGTPTSTSSPASWLKLTVGGVFYYLPLYQ
jgi:hypothetical protein